MHKDSLVSVIITTKNEEAVLDVLLKSIKQQTYSNIEIILVDNNSSDRTKEIAKNYTKLVFNQGPERCVQRNFGASKAQGEYLLFLDADMRLSSNIVEVCVRKFLESVNGNTLKKLGGIIVPEISFGEGYWAKVKAFERSFYIEDDTVESARFYQKGVFLKVGGFDEKILGFEDLDLSNRVRKDYAVERIKSYIYHNEKRPTLLGMARKSYLYAQKTDLLLSKWKTSPFSPKTIYFLRPAFYRQWKKLLFHPLLTISMILMLSLQLSFGAVSYLKHKKVI